MNRVTRVASVILGGLFIVSIPTLGDDSDTRDLFKDKACGMLQSLKVTTEYGSRKPILGPAYKIIDRQVGKVQTSLECPREPGVARVAK
jgi:hypothetical protein